MQYTFLVLFFFVFTHVYGAQSASKPVVLGKLQLAESYSARVNIPDYLVSEKLDGIRARWTGQRLVSRNGNPIHAPQWFTQNWPSQPMDGELWTKRNDFERISSIVMSLQPDDRWQQVTFMLFDLPIMGKSFSWRYKYMQDLVASTQSPYLQVITQSTLPSLAALESRLTEVTNGGGEGLMLHLKQSYYHHGRNKNLLKLKKFDDDEAQVVAILPGKGKYAGMMGSLLVKTKGGKQFKLGSGFSDKQRRHPPAIGSWVTFKFYGYTKRGIPRFATFMRIRPDSDNPAASAGTPIG
ncbi:DNA ligase [Alteromonas sp. C1M14]|uniref:DNA ligase n=1 Tax=Alteromonas sp. C1M14 TaxID=2841567 RepID=UPI001C09CE80|nr:DNA ligase [Alteromonas sp. C1M14]MBU2976737.1 DNA ligase [Alteromonas sp. C1M14]